MTRQIKSMTVLSLVSALAFSAVTEASLREEEQDAVRVSFIAPAKSVLVQSLKTNCIETLIDLENYSAKRAIQKDLLSRASQGSIEAVRELATTAENPLTAMSWYYTEMLMSFGTSFDFSQLLKHSKFLGNRNSHLAFRTSFNWIRDNLNTPSDNLIANEPAPTNLTEAINQFVDKGDARGFLEYVKDSNSKKSQQLYLGFFLNLALENNYSAAFNLLQSAAANKFRPASELLAVINYLFLPDRPENEEMLIKTLMCSKAPQMKNVYAVFNGEEKSFAYPTDMSELSDNLKGMLKLKEN